MAIINKKLEDQDPDPVNTDYEVEMLTVPAGMSYAITTIMVCNTRDPNLANPEEYTCSFDLHFIPSGESLDDEKTVVVRKLELPAGETFTFDSEKIVLGDSDKVTIYAAPNSFTNLTLAATVSYLEV